MSEEYNTVKIYSPADLIKEKNKKKQMERLKYYEEMHKKQDEEREIRRLKEQEKLKKLDEKHLQEMKQIDEYYQNQNILLNQKMQLESQYIENKFYKNE